MSDISWPLTIWLLYSFVVAPQPSCDILDYLPSPAFPVVMSRIKNRQTKIAQRQIAQTKIAQTKIAGTKIAQTKHHIPFCISSYLAKMNISLTHNIAKLSSSSVPVKLN